MLNKILKLGNQVKDHQVLGVIISPTQELAIQTDDVVKKFASNIPGIRTHVMVGGLSLTMIKHYKYIEF